MFVEGVTLHGAWPGAADSPTLARQSSQTASPRAASPRSPGSPRSPRAEVPRCGNGGILWDGSMPTTSRFCSFGGTNLESPIFLHDFCQFFDDLTSNGFGGKPVYFWLLLVMWLSLISTVVQETLVVNAIVLKTGAFERNLAKKRLRAEVDQSNCWQYMASNWLLGITTIVAKKCKRLPLQESVKALTTLHIRDHRGRCNRDWREVQVQLSDSSRWRDTESMPLDWRLAVGRVFFGSNFPIRGFGHCRVSFF